MSKAPLQHVSTLGIDIGKNSFHLIGPEARGAIVLRRKLSRGQVEQRLADMPQDRWATGTLFEGEPPGGCRQRARMTAPDTR